MSADKQAYAGQADPSAGMSEFNRLEFMMRMVINRMATTTLVKVVAVNGLAVDVQPLVGQTDGAGNVTEHGTIHNIPFARVQAGTNAVILDPVVGDMGVCAFAHNDISTVKKSKEPGPPGSYRKFDWSDGMYLFSIAGMSEDPTQFVRIDADGVAITSEGTVDIEAPDGATVTGDLAVTEKFGANGATPQAPATLVPALAPTATNAHIVALLNPIRELLIANGLAV